MITMYGIPNCDTVKKACVFLEKKGVPYQFHDYKKQGVDASKLKSWCQEFGYEQVVNRKGTTWRKLDEAVRDSLTEAKAIKLMIEQPSLIKRPILESGKQRILGFDEAAYSLIK
jgi:arsenate reductase (glutaredoxin)